MRSAGSRRSAETSMRRKCTGGGKEMYVFDAGTRRYWRWFLSAAVMLPSGAMGVNSIPVVRERGCYVRGQDTPNMTRTERVSPCTTNGTDLLGIKKRQLSEGSRKREREEKKKACSCESHCRDCALPRLYRTHLYFCATASADGCDGQLLLMRTTRGHDGLTLP